jgi:hypothetical protein
LVAAGAYATMLLSVDWGLVVETKQHILKAIEGLVADPRVEEAIDHFYLIFKVE